jgi:hypothetical protein
MKPYKLTLISFVVTTKNACDLSKAIKGILVAYDASD